MSPLCMFCMFKSIVGVFFCYQQMHIVYIKEEYANLSQAGADRNGIAVLGFLFEVIMRKKLS